MSRARLSEACTVEGCQGAYRALGLCKRHYAALQRRRAGIEERKPAKNPRPKTKTKRPKYPSTCSYKDCERAHRAKGYCAYHYNLVYYPPKTTQKRGKEIVGYRAVHKRVEKAYGKATTHMCVSCSDQAREWSLDAEATDLLFDEKDRPYTLDVSMYSPRCIRCHRAYDGGMSWSDV